MHVCKRTNTHLCMSQLLGPSTLLSGWTLGTLCFQNPCPEAERFRSGLETEQGGLNLKHTGPQKIKRHTQVALSWNKPVKSSSLQNLNTFYSNIDFTHITHLPHIIHLVMPHTHWHARSVYIKCAHELLLLPLLDCTGNHLIYNYHDIQDKSQKGLSLL